MEVALEKAKAHGLAFVTNHHSAPPGTAAIGYYAEKIAEHDLIALIFSGSSKKVAALNTYEPIFGSNPRALGAPTMDKPIVVDVASSISPVFKAVQDKLLHRYSNEPFAYDKSGNPTKDPEQALAGALFSLTPSPKSGAFGFIVEILTGPLAGGAIAHAKEQTNWGNSIIIIDPELSVGRETFKQSMEELKHAIKQSKPIPPGTEVFYPSEHTNQLAVENEKYGTIEIEDALFELVNEKAHK